MSLAIKAARSQFAGDPGLFGSIGKFIGGVARTVGGILPGPVGFGLKTIGGLIGGRRPQPVRAQQFVGPPVNGRRQATARAGFFGGPGGGVPGAAARAAIPVEAGLACPTGMHPNRAAYFLKSGEFVEKHSRCVSNRKRNPANSRATDRAIGRIESAKKMAARLGRISIRKECPGK